jgi:hypothetical protein
LHSFRRRSDANVIGLFSQAPFAKAFGGAVLDGEVLIRYGENSAMLPENSALEGQIGPIALGRANWIFSDSPRVARVAATMGPLSRRLTSMVSNPTRGSNERLSNCRRISSIVSMNSRRSSAENTSTSRTLATRLGMRLTMSYIASILLLAKSQTTPTHSRNTSTPASAYGCQTHRRQSVALVW